MSSRGRDTETERKKAVSKILQTLEKYPDTLGVRELRRESGIGSFETFYKHLKGLLEKKDVVFREVSVGRGKPKKIFKISKKGIAYRLEFRILDYFERVRESCKENGRFEIDNYAFSYAIYGIPKNLNQEERRTATTILRKLNSTLLELDDLRDQAINKEAYRYREAMAKVHAKIFQHVSEQNKDGKAVVIDGELQKELDGYPSSVRNKMKLNEKEDFALVITRGPSFIDEYSLRPENHLLDLVQAVESWDHDGVDSVIKQLARNRHVNAEAIERLKQWDTEGGKIPNYYWQQIKNRLDDIPKIREEMKKEKEHFIQSGDFKRVLGLGEEMSIVVTKEMLGKRKLDKLRKELSDLNNS